MKHFFDSRNEIGRALLGFKPAFIQAGGFSLIINFLMLTPAIYMLQIYDRVLASRNSTTLLMLTVLVIFLYILFSFLDNVRGKLLVRIGVGIDNVLRRRVFSAAFERHLRKQGPNPAQAIQDLTTTRQFLAGTGALALFDTPWIPIYLAVITLIHPWLGLFSLVAAIVLAAMAWMNELLTQKPLAEANAHSMGAQVFAANNLRNPEAIEAMGMLPAIEAHWEERQQKVLSLQTLASDRGTGIGSMSKASRLAFQSLILGLGGYLAITGDITPGGMIAASILMGRALAPVEQLIGAWRQWVSVRTAHARLVELLVKFPESEPSLTLPAPQGAVSFEGASAVPPGGTVPVLRNLSFRINPGDVVGVIGPSAAGKSSLARLLMGIWAPAAGNVRLDGADIHAWPSAELGPHVGYLPQDIGLCDGTVAQNIARFGEVDSNKVIEAAKLAGVHDLILHLPNGYETLVGADGGALSGGQRQRIALARAMYGNPKLVVLDEPNSNLDEAGEAALLQAITNISQRGGTVVYIAHGQRILSAANKLLALRDGMLLAYGPSDQVVAHLQSLTEKARAATAALPKEANQT